MNPVRFVVVALQMLVVAGSLFVALFGIASLPPDAFATPVIRFLAVPIGILHIVAAAAMIRHAPAAHVIHVVACSSLASWVGGQLWANGLKALPLLGLATVVVSVSYVLTLVDARLHGAPPATSAAGAPTGMPLAQGA